MRRHIKLSATIELAKYIGKDAPEIGYYRYVGVFNAK
jgi:hypothetical protein